MIQSTNLLQNNIQDFFIRNTSYQKSFSPNNKNLLNAKNDNLSLSNESKSLQSLDSKPIDQLIYERKTSIDFQYSFTNSFIQVQSKGNYNIHQQSGFLSMNISFVQRVEKDDDKLTLYPFKVNVSLNFSMYDEQVNNKSGKKIIKPDIKKVVQKILNEIFDLTKDGQNKSIILEFENNDTLKELCKLEEGKVLKMLYNYLAIIAQMNNPFDKDGKRDIVKLLVKDQTKEFDYEQRDLSINITNIDLKFSFDYEEFKEIFLSNAEELVNI